LGYVRYVSGQIALPNIHA